MIVNYLGMLITFLESAESHAVKKIPQFQDQPTSKTNYFSQTRFFSLFHCPHTLIQDQPVIL